MRLPPNEIELRLVDSEAEAEAFRVWQPEGHYVAVDTETTGLQPFGTNADKLRLVQFGDENTGWAIPVGAWPNGALTEAFIKFDGRIVGHNSPFDEAFLRAAGFNPGVKWDDTYLAHHLLKPLGYHGLKAAAADLYGREVRAGEKWLDTVKQKNRWDWSTIPIDHPAYWGYAALDTVLTARLGNDLLPQVQAEYGEQYARELKVSRMMSDMARRGLPIDVPYAESLVEKWAAEEATIRERLAGWMIEKPGSRQQIITALENDGWEPDIFTESGQPSVNRAVLEGLDHEVADDILRWRRITKWSKTYALPMAESGGRLHPLVSSLRAATGRMSISQPPLQQLPTGPEVRSAILTEEGHKMWAVDYTGQEMRLLAAFASDPGLTQAVLYGGDVHGRIAAELFGPDYTPQQRKWCKNGLYAYSYGALDQRLAITVHSPGAKFRKAVGRAFPGIIKLVDNVASKAEERLEADGMAWARTLGGRRVAVPKSRKFALLNYIAQGSGADMLKIALVKMDEAGLGDRISLVIHDEVLANLPLASGAEEAAAIAECMVTEFRGVPFDAEPQGPADSWGGLVH